MSKITLYFFKYFYKNPNIISIWLGLILYIENTPPLLNDMRFDSDTLKLIDSHISDNKYYSLRPPHFRDKHNLDTVSSMFEPVSKIQSQSFYFLIYILENNNLNVARY